MLIDLKKVVFFLAVSAICVLGVWSFISRDVQGDEQIKVPSAIGTKEDPNARARYEQNRLRSPETGEIPRNIRRKELAFAKTIPTKESAIRLGLNKSANLFSSKVYEWERVGPYNIGGRTRALAFDVSDPSGGTLLAGGVSGGVWRYTANTSTWEKTTHPADLHSVTTIAQDPRPGKTNIWYFGTGEWSGNSASDFSGGGFLGNGIFKSEDGGMAWSQLNSTASGTPHKFDSEFDFIWRIVVDSSRSVLEDVVYAAAYNSIRKSSDGGVTWETKRSGGNQPFVSEYTDVAITLDGVVYATLSSNGDDGGIWRSVDGESWTNITSVGFPAVYRRIVIGIAPSNQNTIYFLGETPGSGKLDHSLWKYTYLSGDGTDVGGIWNNRSVNLPEFGGAAGNFESQNSYDLVVKVKPDNPDVIFVGGTNLYRSTDGFETDTITTWIGGYDPFKNDFTILMNHHPDIHEVIFSPSNPSIMYTGTDGGVSWTANNLASTVSWVSLNTGYYTTQFYTVAINRTANNNFTNVIVGGMQDNGTYFFNSTSSFDFWIEVFGGDGSFSAISNDGDHYYVSAQNGQIFRVELNTLGGNITANTRIDIGDVAETFLFIAPFVLNSNDNTMMFLPRGEELWRNSNLLGIPTGNNQSTNVNWTEMTNARINGENITALSMTETPANRLYYGTDKGHIYMIENAQLGDPVPVDISDFGFPNNGYISCIAIDPNDGDELMVVFSNYQVESIFYSDDAGTSWGEDVSGNLEENNSGSGNGPSVRWAYIHHSNSVHGPVFFAATSTGLYSTTELNGNSTIWVQEGPSTIGNVVVNMVTGRDSDGTVVVATHGGGVYKSSVITSIDGTNIAVPSQFDLQQNYPNPFNPETTIRFILPAAAPVTLIIYNALGQEVRTLLSNEEHMSGAHSVAFDGRSENGTQLASGIYFYRLQSREFSAIKKMLLVK